MNSLPRTVIILSFFLWTSLRAEPQNMDAELTSLAKNLAKQVREHNKKKVTVLDFTDIQGGTSEFGKYVAEQLTVELVTSKQNFSILDRANLKSILAEHKLTATGLVDPENAKKLGQFSGVDSLILGTVLSVGSNVQLTAKVITTDTAEVIGAGKCKFAADETAQQLISRPTIDAQTDGETSEKKDAPVVKKFGDLKVELEQPVRIINGNQLQISLMITNQSTTRSVWAAIRGDEYDNVNIVATDSNGSEFRPQRGTRISGIQVGVYAQFSYHPNTFSPATEITPNDSITVTVPLVSSKGQIASSGHCKLQFELLFSYDPNSNHGNCNVRNVTAELKIK